jgi:hypothetical protein
MPGSTSGPAGGLVDVDAGIEADALADGVAESVSPGIGSTGGTAPAAVPMGRGRRGGSTIRNAAKARTAPALTTTTTISATAAGVLVTRRAT